MLGRRAEAFRRLDEAKGRVAAEVAAGRMSLAEAVDQFRRLNREAKESPDPPQGASALPEDDEALARTVLARVREDPGRAAAVLGRLRDEFRRRFGRGPAPARRFAGATLSFTVTGEGELKLQRVELKLQ